MKAIELTEPFKFTPIEIDAPASPGPDEALVRVHRVGICGTDISGYLGKMPFFNYPVIPGHELGVEILEVGANVSEVKPGDRCSVEPYMNCRQCHACRKGNSNCCENLKVLGVMMNGGLREQFILPAHKLHPSTRLTFEQLALVETLGIGCHAVDRADPRENETLLIIGAGPIGLSVLEFAKLTPARVMVMDMNEHRLEFCRDRMGVERTIAFKGDGSEEKTIRQANGGELPDAVIDATGSVQSMSAALNYPAFTGRLVYVGITTQEIRFPHPLMHRRELTLLSSRNALPKDFKRIIQLIEEGTLDTQPWITHRAPMQSLAENFPDYVKPETGVIKAIVEVTD